MTIVWCQDNIRAMLIAMVCAGQGRGRDWYEAFAVVALAFGIPPETVLPAPIMLNLPEAIDI